MIKSDMSNILKIATLFYKKTAEILVNLPEELSSGQFDEDIMSLEEIFEERYPGEGLGQQLWDFKDDLRQPGFVGAGIIKGKGADRKLLGYLYGYRFIYGDNWDDDMFDDSRWFVDDPDKEKEILRAAAKSGKVVYISNLVIKTLYRLKLVDLVKEVINQIKAQSYQYVAMDAKSDSFRLMMDSSGNPNVKRLSKFGFELVMVADFDGAMVVILKVI